MILGQRFSGVRLVAMAMVLISAVRAGSMESAPNPRATLVYKDGDRVQGKVIERTSQWIVFKSDRFGELRVSPADVVVIPAEPVVKKPAVAAATPAPAPAAPKPAPSAGVAAAPRTPAEKAEATRREEEKLSVWDRFTPALMTARVRRFFGPWKGRVAFSTEVVSDVADRENSSWEARVQRKWERNEVQFSGRFDYAETNNLRTTDVIKGSGLVRHEFSKKIFAHYRPSGEWNRASRRQGVPNEYVLLQQEVGLGYNVLTAPGRTFRTGVSQNRFDVWNEAPVADHTSRGVQSLFEEVELKLPWQMGISQRGAWYPVTDQRDGWENRIELNKKLTETLSTSLRHEIRRHNPDGSAQDFERLKLLFALDF